MTSSFPFYNVVSESLGSLCLEVFQWLILITTYMILNVLNWNSYILSWHIPWISLFWMDYQTVDAQSLEVYDVRLMILSHYCLYPWWSFLSSNRCLQWNVSLCKAMNNGYIALHQPSAWMLQSWILRPPDGVISRAIVISVILTYYTALLSKVLVYGLYLASRNVLLNVEVPEAYLEEEPYLQLCLPCTDISSITSDKSPVLHIPKSIFQRLTSSMLVFHRIKLFKSATRFISRRYDINFSVYTNLVLTTDDVSDSENRVTWDADSVAVVVDNSANTHVWSDLKHFEAGSVTYFDDASDVGVLTIGNESSKPLGRGRVQISILDNSGVAQPVTLEDVLYFPNSPVNIVGVTKLAEQYDDQNGTWIQTRWKRSTFVWDHEKFICDFEHPSCRLPILDVMTGYGSSEGFHAFLAGSGVVPLDPTIPTTGNISSPLDKMPDLCFLPQSQSVASVSTNDDDVGNDNSFDIGDSVRFVRDGINDEVMISEIKRDSITSVDHYTVEFQGGHFLTTTKDFLFHLDDVDIADLPLSLDQIEQHAQHIEKEDLVAILNPPPPKHAKLFAQFMDWHRRLGHLPFVDMFKLAASGTLPKSFKSLKKHRLLCPDCVFGKAKRRPWRTSAQPGTIRSEEDTNPGDKVSLDHIVSGQPGLVPRMDGKHTKQRIVGGAVFKDHVSSYSYTHLQTSLDLSQSISAKDGFEKHADSNGVSVKSYHSDNGIFAEQGFRDAVSDAAQTISYCAVNHHSQNGIAERHIGELTKGSRANLLHAQRRWPEAIGTILWPFAWKYFECIFNAFHVTDDGRTPEQRWTKTDVLQDPKDFHPFGCPVYILDGRLASGNSIPKWQPRARVGVYLGHSPCHAGTVALVLNPRTLRVSPQYHVVFDDEFTTVPYLRSGTIPPQWTQLCKQSMPFATESDFDLATTWANEYISGQVSSINDEAGLDVDDEVNPSTGIILNVPSALSFADGSAPEEALTAEDPPMLSEEAIDPVPVEIETDVDMMKFPDMPDLNDLTLRRSSRLRALCGSKSKVIFTCLYAMFAVFTSSAAQVGHVKPSLLLHKTVLHTERLNQHFDGTLNKLHHAVLNTVAGDNDTYTLKQMLQQEDKNDFIEAMQKEVNDHESRDHWTVIPRSLIPNGTKTIMAIWSFKRKRFPDGRIMKYKARLCAHGGMQTWGENYWETYSPVVNWLSVRTLLAISVVHDLDTRAIDFTLAFPQADLDVAVFMEMPYGFDHSGNRGYVLQLNKNLYGLKQASYNWFQLIKTGLQVRGYENQSSTDPCVFIGKDSIVMVYVDDCIIISKKNSPAADRLIESLKRGHENFVFTDEGDLKQYLGIDVSKKADGSCTLTQTHLIQRFLEVIGLSDANSKSTPAIKPLLWKDLLGLQRKHSWNYRQAVGMLTYMQGTSRPELAFAVHQAARFCIDPRLSHERAIHRIGKYLKGTEDKGITFKPDPNKGLECFVDADFAGGWNKGDASNADAVLSRTGYVIMYAGCPVHWCSKLQTEIALSTTEAEYIALSQSLREVIPLIELLKEINEVFPIYLPTPKIKCKVYEDNESCISLATKQKFSPRTKHIALKYHHFRAHVNNGTIDVVSVDTKEQIADIFTKPLDEGPFIYLRKKLNGW